MTDIAWHELRDHYGRAYDPRPALAALKAGGSDWTELWEELHHQGDVGTVSYAAVVEIVAMIGADAAADWNAYGLIATIEESRAATKNPPLPPALEQPYREAWERLVPVACRHLVEAEQPAVSCILAAIAFAKGLAPLGSIAMWERNEWEEALAR